MSKRINMIVEQEEKNFKKNNVNIARVRNAERENLPLKRSNIYKLHSLRKFPGLIYKVPGAGLCFDLDEWASMCAEAKRKNEERANRIHRALSRT